MSKVNMVLGLGRTDTTSAYKDAKRQWRKTDYYNAWSNVIKQIKKHGLEASDEVLSLKAVQEHLIKQDYVARTKTVKIATVCVTTDSVVKGRVELEDLFVVDTKDGSLFINPRGKRDLPHWVTNPKDTLTYRANIAVYNPEHYELFGINEVIYKFDKDPWELHFWALGHKIANLEVLMGKYPPFGTHKVTHKALGRMVNILKHKLDNREVIAPC